MRDIAQEIRDLETDDPNSVINPFIDLLRIIIAKKTRGVKLDRTFQEIAIDCWCLYAERKKKTPSYRMIYPVTCITYYVVAELYKKNRKLNDRLIDIDSIPVLETKEVENLPNDIFPEYYKWIRTFPDGQLLLLANQTEHLITPRALNAIMAKRYKISKQGTHLKVINDCYLKKEDESYLDWIARNLELIGLNPKGKYRIWEYATDVPIFNIGIIDEDGTVWDCFPYGDSYLQNNAKDIFDVSFEY